MINHFIPLTRDQLLDNPTEQFRRWFHDAERSMGVELAESMCLSTIDAAGFPDGRIVLLKAFDDRGFVFYTNSHSAKGRSLAAVSKAALTFYWGTLNRQVRLQGMVGRVADEEADAYFRTRPRLSQIGAWASDQSDVLEDRILLDRRVEEYSDKFEGMDVTRPPHWTGYRVAPFKIEFWQAHPNRLHDRFVYRKDAQGEWDVVRLNP